MLSWGPAAAGCSSYTVLSGIQETLHTIIPQPPSPNIPPAKRMTSLNYQLSVETTHNARG